VCVRLAPWRLLPAFLPIGFVRESVVSVFNPFWKS